MSEAVDRPAVTYSAQGQHIAQGHASQYNSGGGAINIHEATSTWGKADRLDECRRRLYATDPGIIRDKITLAKGERMPGTCEWILHNDSYQSWLNGEEQLFWISGGPGMGKTMMSVFITEPLEKRDRGNDNGFLLYFFCSVDERRNSASDIFLSLINQVISKHQGLLEPYVYRHFENEDKSRDTKSSPGTLWTIFNDMLRDPVLPSLFCVIDGLDECDETSIQLINSKLTQMTKPRDKTSVRTGCKFMIVSRKTHHIAIRTRIRLDPDNQLHVLSDIERFIQVKVFDLSTSIDMSASQQAKIQQILLERASGTFLWVGFVALQLSLKSTILEVLETLDTVPRGLPALYDRMLQQIAEKGRKHSASIIQFVTVTFRPLTIEELSAATEVDSTSDLTSKQILEYEIELCSPLMQDVEGRVTLVHQSARDYLLNIPSNSRETPQTLFYGAEEAHLAVAKRCIAHLQASVQRDKDSFYQYAMIYWEEHAKASGSLAGQLLAAAPQFFDSDSWAWKECLNYRCRSSKVLHAACGIGATELVRAILLQMREKSLHHVDDSVNSYDDGGQTPLSYAAKGGHVEVVKLLLDTNQVDINAKDYWGMSPLSYAVGVGHEGVVKLLLHTEQMAVNSKSKNGMTPLMYATLEGRLSVVQLLLNDARVEVDAKDNYGQTALHHAAQAGHNKTVEQLVATGKVDVNSQDFWGRTPVMWIVEGADGRRDQTGHQATMKIFLAMESVNIDHKDKGGNTALSLAATYGMKELFELVLNSGRADPHTKDNRGWTLLFIIASSIYPSNEQLAMVASLLDVHGFDPDQKDKVGRTALLLAAESGNQELFKGLLNSGRADPHTKDNTGRTLLSVIASSIYPSNLQLAMVELLLHIHGFDIDCKDMYGRTALSYAAKNDHKKLWNLLVLHSCRVDIHCEDNEGRTPLWYASENTDWILVKPLMQVRTDSEEISFWKTPISYYGKISQNIDQNRLFQ